MQSLYIPVIFILCFFFLFYFVKDKNILQFSYLLLHVVPKEFLTITKNVQSKLQEPFGKTILDKTPFCFLIMGHMTMGIEMNQILLTKNSRWKRIQVLIVFSIFFFYLITI